MYLHYRSETEQNYTIYGGQWEIKSAIADHRLTDAIEFLESRKIPPSWGVMLLPLIQEEAAQ